MAERVYLDQPSIGFLELDYVSRAVREVEISTHSQYVGLFEEALSAKLGGARVIATNSGTTALTVACQLNYSQDATLTLPALTFVATANAVLQAGFRIKIADVDSGDWLLHTPNDPMSLPVDLYGAESDPDCGILRDSCQSVGLPVAIGWDRVYSFNHNKTITCGGGGAIVNFTDNMEMVARATLTQGVVGGYRPYTGVNGKMTGLHAALGLAQLERWDELLTRKRQIHDIYVAELSGIVEFQSPERSTWWMTAGKTRVPASVMFGLLAEVGIPSRRVFTPLHYLIPHCHDGSRLGYAEKIYHYGICLPSSVLNTDDAVKRVCTEVKRIIKEYKL